MFGQCDDMSAEAVPQSNQDCECRIILHALKTWTDARKGDELPAFADLAGMVNSAGEQEILTENQFLILVDAHLPNSVVIFYGSDLPKLVGQRNVRRSLQSFLPVALSGIFSDACMEAVNNGDVVNRHGMINTPSGASVFYRSIFMPLRSENKHPDCTYVFGAFSSEDVGGERITRPKLARLWGRPIKYPRIK